MRETEKNFELISEISCPLCGRTSIVPYHRDKARDYLNCRTCNLVFVPPAQHISASDEKACYDLHDNQPGDPGWYFPTQPLDLSFSFSRMPLVQFTCLFIVFEKS